jgi:hypothetical protein
LAGFILIKQIGHIHFAFFIGSTAVYVNRLGDFLNEWIILEDQTGIIHFSGVLLAARC